MRAVLLVVFMLASLNANATNYICSAFKAVALIDNGGNDPSIMEVDVFSTKYLLKEVDEVYTFTEPGTDFEMPCVSSNRCSCGSASWCGNFTKNEMGFFTFHADKEFTDGSVGSAIVKGKCKKVIEGETKKMPPLQY
ncbi:MAG: hypothetical protein AB8C02_13450 [Halioglobus sp.]